jgi:hypothetical protein
MTDTIIKQEEIHSIDSTDEWRPPVPYFAAERPDGNNGNLCRTMPKLLLHPRASAADRSRRRAVAVVIE